MIKAYTIASGKGGTGKTTMTVNLGTALAQLGKETYILDADVGMANIGILLGLENVPVTLHEVLAGKATVEEAAYEGPAGLKVVPCGISLQGFQDANPDRLREVMHELVNRCDYLLIDAPAGISRDGVVPLAIADEVILVVNPELSSIVDALKTKILTELVGGNVRHAIINRAGRDNIDFVERKIEKSLGVQTLGAVPEDTFVRESAAYKMPIVIKHPGSPASKAIKRIAAEIAGCEYHDDGAMEREGFIDRLARTLFRGKN